MRICEVTWDDAFVSTGDYSVKKCQTLKPIRTKTIGYVVAENDLGIVMAADMYPKDTKHVKIINLIPWGMIVDWEELCDG